MFPKDIVFPEKIEIDEDKEDKSKSVGRSFVFDYITGQHMIVDGKPKETTQLKAIEQWLELLLRTKIGKYVVYKDTSFGTTWENYISFRQLPKGYIESELEREIQESCQKYCPAVEKVSNFSAERLTEGLKVSFTAVLTNKDVLEVRVDVF